MKEHIKRLGKGTIIYGAGQVLTKLISFLLLPLFTAYLTPADYGIVAILGVISFLAAPVFGLGLGTSMGIVYFEDAVNRKQATTSTSFVILLISSFLFLLISFLFAPQISALAFGQTQYDTTYFIKLTAVSTIFSNIIVQPITLRLQFEERSKLFVLLTTISTLITICLTVFFVVYLRGGVEGFIIASVIGSVITFFLYFISIIRWTKFTFDGEVARQLLKLGYPIIPSFVFLFVIQNSGRYMLEQMMGLAEVGVYSIGNNFGMINNIAVTAFTAAWFPYFNSFVNNQQEARRVFGRNFTYYVLGGGSLSVLFFIFAKPAVVLMTQEPFHEAYRVVGLTATSYFLVGAFSILVAGTYFARKVHTINFSQSGAAVMCIGLNFLLIPWIGIIGAGISFLAANLGLCLFQYVINRGLKVLDVSYEWIRIGYFTLGATVVILLTFLPREFTFLQEVLLSVGLSVILFILVYFQLTAAEKNFIFSSLKSFKEKFTD